MHDGLGQHPAPTHVVAHLSDTHLLAGGALLGGAIDTAAHLRDALARLELAAPAADALVVSGDCTDLGEPEAYALLRELVEPVAERMGATVVYAAGNHDERAPMWRVLHDVDSDAPYDGVHEVAGLRIVSLDTQWTDVLVAMDGPLAAAAMDPRLEGGRYPWQDTIAHEYIHLVVTHHTADRAPVWPGEPGDAA